MLTILESIGVQEGNEKEGKGRGRDRNKSSKGQGCAATSHT